MGLGPWGWQTGERRLPVSTDKSLPMGTAEEASHLSFFKLCPKTMPRLKVSTQAPAATRKAGFWKTCPTFPRTTTSRTPLPWLPLSQLNQTLHRGLEGLSPKMRLWTRPVGAQQVSPLTQFCDVCLRKEIFPVTVKCSEGLFKENALFSIVIAPKCIEFVS